MRRKNDNGKRRIMEKYFLKKIKRIVRETLYRKRDKKTEMNIKREH